MNSKTTLFKILFIVCFAFCQTSNAQLESVEWLKTAGNQFRQETKSIATDQNDNIYMTGFFSNSIIFENITLTAIAQSDIFFVKYDSSGNVLWAKSFNTGIQPEGGYNLTVDANNNVYMVGRFMGSSLNLGNITLTGQEGYTKMFVAKFDSDGNALWGNTIKSTYTVNPVAFYDIALDSGGNIIISGTFEAEYIINNTEIITNGTGSYILKYNPQGTLLWHKHNTGYTTTLITSIIIDGEDNIYFTGKHSGDMSIDNVNLYGSGIITGKYDSEGNLNWLKQASTTSANNQSFDISLDTSGNVYITGTYADFQITFGDYVLPGIFNVYNAFLVKYDSLGEVVWAKNSVPVSVSPNSNLGARGGKCLMNENSLLVYGCICEDTKFGDYTLTLNEGSSVTSFIAKYNLDGTIDWIKKINSTALTVYDNYIDFIKDSQNNVIISGICFSNTIFGQETSNSNGIFLAKVASSVLSNQEFILGNNVMLFPNPVNGVLNINSKENIDQLNIYNTLGQNVRSINSINTQEYGADLSQLSAGYYLVEIISGQSKSQQKIIKL